MVDKQDVFIEYGCKASDGDDAFVLVYDYENKNPIDSDNIENVYEKYNVKGEFVDGEIVYYANNGVFDAEEYENEEAIENNYIEPFLDDEDEDY